jgi:hypothetical protein
VKIINTDLIRSPYNWAIVLLMLIIAGAFGHLVLSYFGVEPKTDSDTGVSNGIVSQS